MSYGVIKPKAIGIYNNIEVGIYGETIECYYIYVKNIICGYVDKNKVKLL